MNLKNEAFSSKAEETKMNLEMLELKFLSYSIKVAK